MASDFAIAASDLEDSSFVSIIEYCDLICDNITNQANIQRFILKSIAVLYLVNK